MDFQNLADQQLNTRLNGLFSKQISALVPWVQNGDTGAASRHLGEEQRSPATRMTEWLAEKGEGRGP